MNERQKELLYTLGNTFLSLAEECKQDEFFHQIMIKNNDLFPMSLDELGFEWLAVADEER